MSLPKELQEKTTEEVVKFAIEIGALDMYRDRFVTFKSHRDKKWIASDKVSAFLEKQKQEIFDYIDNEIKEIITHKNNLSAYARAKHHFAIHKLKEIRKRVEEGFK